MRMESRPVPSRTTVTAEEGQRRRQETTIQLRKSKKEQQLAKRRQLNVVEQPNTITTLTENKTTEKQYGVDDLPNLVSIIQKHAREQDCQPLIEATRAIRRMLSVEKAPPVKKVILAGALPHLVEMLMRVDSEVLQFEACWALTNVASTQYTADVVKTPNALPYLTLLLRSNAPNVREQAAWCLGNIAGESVEYRNIVLDAGALEALVLNMQQPANPTLLSNVTWSVSNLCRGKPLPPLELMKPVILLFANLVRSTAASTTMTSQQKGILVDALWGLSYLSDGDNERIEAVQATGVAEYLVHYLQKGAGLSDTAKQHRVLATPALRIMGNFVSGSVQQTQVVLDVGILDGDLVLNLLQGSGASGGRTRQLRKETCWLLSNIAAGSKEQVNMLMSRPQIVSALTKLALEAEWETRKEALWAVSNMCTQGTDDHVCQLLVQQPGQIGDCGPDAVKAMLSILKHQSDSKMVMVGLDAIQAILEVGDRHELGYEMIVEECGGITILEDLQEHSSHKVYERAVDILVNFFGGDDYVDNDENMAPEVGKDTFSFGVASSSGKKYFDNSDDALSVSSPPLLGFENTLHDYNMTTV